MTTVKIKIEFPEAEGNIPAHGYIEFRPTARQILNDSVVLPNAFTVELDENGEATVELAPTTTYFVWGVREKTHAGENFYVTIPNTILEVAYEDLVRVDPETLDPIVAIPAWEDLEQRVEDLEEGSIGIITPETVFTVQGGATNTQPTFDGTPLFTGSYVKIGQVVHFQIQVDFDNITNFGTGQYYVDLPFPVKNAYKFREGCLHDISTGKDYETGGHVNAGSSRLFLTSTDAQGNSVFDIPFTSTNPITLSTADNFHISGTYITE